MPGAGTFSGAAPAFFRGDLLAWVRDARPGDRIACCQGDLGTLRRLKRFSALTAREAAALANAEIALAEEAAGRLRLTRTRADGEPLLLAERR